MKIAILGVAHVHARQLIEISRNKPQFDVVGIWDREPERAAALAGAFGMPFRESIDSLLAEKPDCAFVFSENRYHRELCLRAAASVKNILCEKPLATNYRDAAEMVETCERRGVNLKVAFNNRFTAPAGQAAKLLREGKLGPVLGISGTNHGRNPGGWFTDPALAGGGALVDHTVHLVDLVYWLTGLKPVSVYAQTGTLFNDIVCEDCGFLAAELEGGIPFTVDFSWSRPEGFPAEGDNKLEIQCAGGVCLIDNRGECLEKCTSGVYELCSYGSNAYEEMLDDFADCVAGKPSIGASGREALVPVRVVDAAYRSVKTGKPVTVYTETEDT